MIDQWAIAQSVLSACTLALITAGATWAKKRFDDFQADFGALKESQRNQLKASIVKTCNEAFDQGFILATELETLNRRADSYWQLDGNSYVRTLIDHVNNLPVRGNVPPHD